jgi:hypothetical protein
MPGFNYDRLPDRLGRMEQCRQQHALIWSRGVPDCAVSADVGLIRAADAAVPLPTIPGDIDNDIRQ